LFGRTNMTRWKKTLPLQISSDFAVLWSVFMKHKWQRSVLCHCRTAHRNAPTCAPPPHGAHKTYESGYFMSVPQDRCPSTSTKAECSGYHINASCSGGYLYDPTNRTLLTNFTLLSFFNRMWWSALNNSDAAHRTATYRCDDTRCCIIQFWPPDGEHIVLETCRGI